MNKNTKKNIITCPKCGQKLLKVAYVDLVVTCTCDNKVKVKGELTK
jgi:hypothetical protein